MRGIHERGGSDVLVISNVIEESGNFVSPRPLSHVRCVWFLVFVNLLEYMFVRVLRLLPYFTLIHIIMTNRRHRALEIETHCYWVHIVEWILLVELQLNSWFGRNKSIRRFLIWMLREI
jgi:hypothetical protein